MVEDKPSAGIGIDLGSSSVRVSLYNFTNDKVIACSVTPVPYYYTSESVNWKYTQSTQEILEGIHKCFNELHLEDYKIKGCGVGATCSLAIFRKENAVLEPWNFEDPGKNVVFWMDSIATNETQQINELAGSDIRAHMGGNFVPEMAIPKLKHFINLLENNNNTSSFELMDLHRYIAMALAQEYGWDYGKVCNAPNTNAVGHDGELAGWSIDFYQNVVQLPQNITIGPLTCPHKLDGDIPKISSCIDCYSNWFALLSTNIKNSLFVVGGTSTCYLQASTEFNHNIPGIWGPFANILDPSDYFSVYEAGQSCTGKLIEHLFNTHPASSHLDSKDLPLLFTQIDHFIEKAEQTTGTSIHMQTKHMFFYGDLEGNRTPYADPAMSGMFIGETTDTTFRNLVYKYVCILEFIAFQVKHMLSIFNDLNEKSNINELQFCGSQAKNERLLHLIALLNPSLKIQIPQMDVALIGAYGSYLMGKASTLEKSIVEVVHNYTYPYVLRQQDNVLLQDLLEVKYEIYFEMAEQQKNYRQRVNSALNSSINIGKDLFKSLPI